MNNLITEQNTSVLFQNYFVEMRFSKSLSLLTVKWKRQISFEERVFGYKTAIEFLKEYQVENLLVNNEKIFLLPSSDKSWLAATLSKWLIETWVKKFALVTSYLYQNMMDLPGFTDTLKRTNKLSGQIEHEIFIDNDIARIWLCPNEDL